MSEAASDAFATPNEAIPPLPRISVQAFCETEGVASVIAAARADRRAAKAQVKINSGGVPAAIEAFRAQPTPNLILLETNSDRDTLFAQLDTLADFCDAGTKVVIIGHENDISLYRELTAKGVSDYIVAPLLPLMLIKAVAKLYHSPGAETLGRMLAIFGAKGGVGASSIAHNVAWSISTGFESHTIVADLDLPFGTAGLDFNQDPPQGIAEAVFSLDRLDANMIDRLLWKCSENLSILSAPATLDRCYDLSENAFDTVLDLLRSAAPCTILDIPHHWSAWTRRVLVASDEVAIVAAPDLANLRNVKALVDALIAARPNDKPPKLILNGVGAPKRPEIAVQEFAKAIGVNPSAVVPFDPRLFGAAANNGQMLAEVDPGSGIVATIDALARDLLGKTVVHQSSRSLLAPLLARFTGRRAG